MLIWAFEIYLKLVEIFVRPSPTSQIPTISELEDRPYQREERRARNDAGTGDLPMDENKLG